jgi:hypothetical protein
MKRQSAIRLCVSLAAMVAAPSVAGAQDSTATRPTIGPPIQRITTASALSTERLGTITSVRELRDGRVLLNDGTRRRLLLMDTTLAVVGVVLDSLSEIANTYGTRPGALIPYRADTTLFVDPASYAIVVLDPEAKITRIRSVWRVQDISYFASASGIYGVPGLDAKGRVVYRRYAEAAMPLVAPPAGVPYIPPEPDSAFIIAVDLDTRRLDTLGIIRIPKSAMSVRRTVEGRIMFEQVINPLPSTDEWAVLPDGTVAFVRALDYRIEYLNPDGTTTSSAKLPYEWQRLTDEDKQRLVDSVRVARQRTAATSYVSSMIQWVNMYGRSYPTGFTVPEGYVLPPGMPRDWILPEGVRFPENYRFACPPGVEPPAPSPGAAVAAPPPGAAGVPTSPGAAGAPPPCTPAPIVVTGGVVPPVPTLRTVNIMHPSELPDYRPPIPTGSVRADMDGNLWIRTNPPRPIPGGPVYDIVSREGELVNRIQLPQGYTLVGFGRGKVVYLSMRDASGIHLARVRLR